MTIYKVRIRVDGDKTIYTVNQQVLSTITHLTDTGKYEVTAPSKNAIVDNAAEAETIAKDDITNLFTKLGIVPNFIND